MTVILALLGVGGFQGGAGVVYVVVVEYLCEPLVDARSDCCLSDVDGLGVLLLGYGVLSWELAAVVRLVVVPGALHLPTTNPAAHHATEYVGAAFGFLAADR